MDLLDLYVYEKTQDWPAKIPVRTVKPQNTIRPLIYVKILVSPYLKT